MPPMSMYQLPLNSCAEIKADEAATSHGNTLRRPDHRAPAKAISAAPIAKSKPHDFASKCWIGISSPIQLLRSHAPYTSTELPSKCPTPFDSLSRRFKLIAQHPSDRKNNVPHRCHQGSELIQG